MPATRSQSTTRLRGHPTHQPAPNDPPVSATLTVEEAAEILGVGRRTAYKAVATGELPSLRLGNRLVIPRAKLNAMLGIVQTPSEGTG